MREVRSSREEDDACEGRDEEGQVDSRPMLKGAGVCGKGDGACFPEGGRGARRMQEVQVRFISSNRR